MVLSQSCSGKDSCCWLGAWQRWSHLQRWSLPGLTETHPKTLTSSLPAQHFLPRELALASLGKQLGQDPPHSPGEELKEEKKLKCVTLSLQQQLLLISQHLRPGGSCCPSLNKKNKPAKPPSCFPHTTATRGFCTPGLFFLSWGNVSLQRALDFLPCVICKSTDWESHSGCFPPFPPASSRRRNSNYLAFQTFPFPPRKNNQHQTESALQPISSPVLPAPTCATGRPSSGACWPTQGALLEERGWSLPK